MTDYDEIRRLMARFLDGATTIAEERRLYDAFAPGRPLPPDLEKLRPMMGWYASGLGSVERRFPTAGPDEHNSAADVPKKPFRLLPFHYVSIAASLLILFALGSIFFSENSGPTDLYEEYAGSYAVVNGHRITDPAVVVRAMEDIDRRIELRRAAMTPPEIPQPDEMFFDAVSADNPALRYMIQNPFNDNEFQL